VSPEALVLALSAVVRPTTVTVVIAMLSTGRPQRLLAAYILGGIAFTLTVGVLVVVLLQGLGPERSDVERPVVDIVLGAVSLAYSGAVAAGLLVRRAKTVTADEHGARSWMRRRLDDMSPSGAALAGVLTHLPGLVYLAALNAIVGSATGALDGVIQVLAYNAIWFSLAIVALVMSTYRPAVSRDGLERGAAWTRGHRRMIIVVFCGILGVYLLVSGISELARSHVV
jgi:hypothetical protein